MKKYTNLKLLINLFGLLIVSFSCTKPPGTSNGIGDKVKSIRPYINGEDTINFAYNNNSKVSLISWSHLIGASLNGHETNSINVSYDALGNLIKTNYVRIDDYPGWIDTIGSLTVFYEYVNNKIKNFNNGYDTFKIDYDILNRLSVVTYNHDYHYNMDSSRADTIHYDGSTSNIEKITTSFCTPGVPNQPNNKEYLAAYDYDLSRSNPFYTINDLFFIVLGQSFSFEIRTIPNYWAGARFLQPYLLLTPNYPKSIYTTLDQTCSGFAPCRTAFNVDQNLNSFGRIDYISCLSQGDRNYISFDY